MISTQMVSKFTIHYDHFFSSNRKKNQLAFFSESFNVFKQKLLDFTQSKSQDCYIIENFKYPRQQQIIVQELTSFIKFQLIVIIISYEIERSNKQSAQLKYPNHLIPKTIL
ncbi:unnamed protein product (macronuclear) [Paramecium tetraurelia]|uniref:Transmembrane protein n=1 Tax=Paramecium tetraurelia TaxID=5888 RepID=A0BE38_PARTE|nr:uncharacterized protein GSPATT00027837001 [Paramecium tetraurelia]CAK56805.1 unnamed protein product [Paramecium tetraurelia]|eukprot:XP_001424203.1 hypothetical protein (macronuclear) [Paramecium tetraurelia strain d4-2]